MSIDIGDLDTVAKLLATGAMGIDELGSDPAPIPDAGAATALLVDALGSIASALDAAVRFAGQRSGRHPGQSARLPGRRVAHCSGDGEGR